MGRVLGLSVAKRRKRVAKRGKVYQSVRIGKGKYSTRGKRRRGGLDEWLK